MDVAALLSIAPKIVLFLLVFLSIALFVEFFYLRKKKKQKVLTKETIPDLPKENTGSAKFATSYKATASKKPLNVNKKMLFSVIALGVVAISGLSVFLATKNQPQTTQSKAQDPCAGKTICRENAILEMRGNKLTGGGKFGHYGTSGAASVTLKVQSFYCADSKPGDTGCHKPLENYNVSDTLEPGDRQVEIVGELEMDTPCGGYQIDTSWTASTGESGPAGSFYQYTGTQCESEPTPSSVPPSGTPIPSATTTPVPTATPIPTSTVTPPPGSTNTPVPSVTSTPVPSSTVTMTPVPGTPTPSLTPPPGATNTPYIVVTTATPPAGSTNTPTAPAPTIPSAGSPLPFIAIGIPLILIFLAFIL